MMSHLLQNAQEVSEKARQMEIWQERAYTAENRVSGLEQERQKLRDEVERLRGVIWQAQYDLDYDENNAQEVCVFLCAAIGHKAHCKKTVYADAECNCDGVSGVSE